MNCVFFYHGLRSAIILVVWFLNYCLLVFIAVLGVLQLAAYFNNYRGLLFFPRKVYSLIFAVFAICFALFAFFTWNDFNTIIVEGSQQTGLFVLATAVGIIFTLVFSSLLNYRRLNRGKSQQDGLDVLRESTFFQAFHNQRDKEE